MAGATFLGLLLTPLGLVCALAIKMDSKGSVFFRQERLGRKMKKFRILKFRTMTESTALDEIQITASNNPRITRVGKILRKTKLDEIPQLWNILLGQMSFVGPRPEVPRYAAYYPTDFEEILEIKPGLTDLASIHFIDEEENLGDVSDLEKSYIEKILPEKLRLQKLYLENQGLLLDFKIFSQTFFAIFKR